MTQKSEFYIKLHKWADNIEHTLADWAHESVEEYYKVEDIIDLTEDDIIELKEFVARNRNTGYDHILMAFTNIIDYWESENEHD